MPEDQCMYSKIYFFGILFFFLLLLIRTNFCPCTNDK